MLSPLVSCLPLVSQLFVPNVDALLILFLSNFNLFEDCGCFSTLIAVELHCNLEHTSNSCHGFDNGAVAQKIKPSALEIALQSELGLAEIFFTVSEKTYTFKMQLIVLKSSRF